MNVEAQLEKINQTAQSINDYMAQKDIDSDHLMGMMKLLNGLQKTLLTHLKAELNEHLTDEQIFAEGLQRIDDAIGCFSAIENNAKANAITEILHYILCNEESKTIN